MCWAGLGWVMWFGVLGLAALGWGLWDLCVQFCYQGRETGASGFYKECAGLGLAGLGCVVWCVVWFSALRLGALERPWGSLSCPSFSPKRATSQKEKSLASQHIDFEYSHFTFRNRYFRNMYMLINVLKPIYSYMYMYIY